MSYLSISAQDGGTFNAYIARPEHTEERAPVIILIQEIFGINQEMREKCEDWAKRGYIAICPDLFWRIEPGIDLVDSIPEQLQRAFALFGLFNVEIGMKDLQATLTHARTIDGANGKVGCAGYCLGGKLAYLMATETDIDASVGYYGVMIETMLDKAGKITHPLLLHIAGNDQFVPPAAQEKIIAAFQDNPHVVTYAYAGAQHAFARGNGMHYDEAAATLANHRTYEFLDKNLKA